VASTLRDWLPVVIQDIDPWMSAEDIEVGSRWLLEISSQLEQTLFGIVCLTPENRERPWINFEAGALSKAISASRVVPLLMGMKKTDIVGPLSSFQAIEPTEAEMHRLLTALNSANDSQLSQDVLKRTFDRWWPDLESSLDDIRKEMEDGSPAAGAGPRDDRDLLEEVLARVRSQDRRLREQERLLRGRPTIGDLRGSVRIDDSREVPAHRPSDLFHDLDSLLGSKIKAGRNHGERSFELELTDEMTDAEETAVAGIAGHFGRNISITTPDGTAYVFHG